MWKCIYLPTGKEVLRRGCNLAKFSTGKELEDNNQNQPGFRNYLYNTSKRNALLRKHEFNLTKDEFNKLIGQNCYYCNESPRPATNDQLKKRGNTSFPTIYYNGIDRIDSSIGYQLDNVVPCCPTCNYMKRILTQENFYKHIIKIYNNLNLGSTTIPEGSTSQVDNGGGNGEPLTQNNNFEKGEDIV